MTKYPKIEFERSDGTRFTINNYMDDSSGWVMMDRNGWDELELSVNLSENVLRDGSKLVAKRVDAKDRSVSARYIGAKTSDAVKAQARTFFNPKFTFKAHYTLGDVTRWCEGELYGVKVTDGPFTDLDVTLLCPDPYFKDERKNDQPFDVSEAQFGWPYVSHLAEANRPQNFPVGFNVSRLVFDGKNTVYNGGDVPTYYRVIIEAKGDIINPAISKDDKIVRVLTTLRSGDKLVIDFEASPPKVLLNGQNIIQKCSRDSNFVGMQMQVGANKFTFSLDNVVNRSLAKVTIDFYKKYLGA